MKSIINIKSRRASFTLVELLIATTMIILVLGGAVSVEVQYLNSAVSNRNDLQATALAQEALNLTRTIRDTNLLTDSNDPYSGVDFCLDKGVCHLSLDGTKWKLDQGDSKVKLENSGNAGTEYTIEVTVTK